jgi:rare lipoprotein A
LAAIIIGAIVSSCSTYRLGEADPTYTSEGYASWYGPGFHGRKTANGERYNQYAMTAAHKSLPFGTKLRVTNLENDKQIVVRVNDRGPYIRGRIIDLSRKGAKQLAMLGKGTAKVRIETLTKKKAPLVKIGHKKIPNQGGE